MPDIDHLASGNTTGLLERNLELGEFDLAQIGFRGESSDHGHERGQRRFRSDRIDAWNPDLATYGCHVIQYKWQKFWVAIVNFRAPFSTPNNIPLCGVQGNQSTGIPFRSAPRNHSCEGL